MHHHTYKHFFSFYSDILTLILQLRFFHRITRNTHQVDAVSISFGIGKIVSKMRSCRRYGFTIGENSHIIRNDLLISETGPPMRHAFLHKLFHTASARSHKQRITCNAVVEYDLTFRFEFFRSIFEKIRRLPVPTVLSVMTIETTNFISNFKVASIS